MRNRYFPLQLALLGVFASTGSLCAEPPKAPAAANGIPAGAPEQQRRFCYLLLHWNEEYSRQVKAVADQPDRIAANALPAAASDKGLAELYAFVGPTGEFRGWRGHPYINANGGSAVVDLQVCNMRNKTEPAMVDVHINASGIPLDSPLAKLLASIKTAKDVVVSGVFLSRTWPNNLKQFLMMPRDIRHPWFAVEVTSVAPVR